jgi:uncharacterized protein (DUF1697 family)
MADLKVALSILGLTDIQTYIQSGNVIFNTQTKDDDFDLAMKIERLIQKEFDLDVPVVVRSSSELQVAVKKNPFYIPEADINRLHLTFLKEKPSAEKVKLAETYHFEPDRFKINNQDVYVYCHGSYHESKLTNNFFESKLKVGATTRNWKTVLKLLELSA